MKTAAIKSSKGINGGGGEAEIKMYINRTIKFCQNPHTRIIIRSKPQIACVEQNYYYLYGDHVISN